MLTPSCGDVIRISAAAAARGAGWAVDERREGTSSVTCFTPPSLTVAIKLSHKLLQLPPAVTRSLVGLGQELVRPGGSPPQLPASPPLSRVLLKAILTWVNILAFKLPCTPSSGGFKAGHKELWSHIVKQCTEAD